MNFSDEEPYFAISIAAKMVGVHAQTLRYYEKAGLIFPERSKGNIRLYSRRDIDKVIQIKKWIDELGVNLAGVEVITALSDRVYDLEKELANLIKEIVLIKERSKKSLTKGGN